MITQTSSYRILPRIRSSKHEDETTLGSAGAGQPRTPRHDRRCSAARSRHGVRITRPGTDRAAPTYRVEADRDLPRGPGGSHAGSGRLVINHASGVSHDPAAHPAAGRRPNEGGRPGSWSAARSRRSGLPAATSGCGTRGPWRPGPSSRSPAQPQRIGAVVAIDDGSVSRLLMIADLQYTISSTPEGLSRVGKPGRSEERKP